VPEAPVSVARSSKIFSTIMFRKAHASATMASRVRSNAELWGLTGGLGVKFVACTKVCLPVTGAEI
jgi:hypothetical protein